MFPWGSFQNYPLRWLKINKCCSFERNNCCSFSGLLFLWVSFFFIWKEQLMFPLRNLLFLWKEHLLLLLCSSLLSFLSVIVVQILAIPLGYAFHQIIFTSVTSIYHGNDLSLFFGLSLIPYQIVFGLISSKYFKSCS